MPKEKKGKTQPQAVANDGNQEENRENKQEQGPERKSVKVTTSEGNTIDKIRVFQKDGNTMVQADYGKLKPEGKTVEERRAGMRTQISRALTPEQAQEYQRLYAEDPAKAKEYAVKQAYPMHVDDAAFHQKEGNINGRDVNYITIEKISENTLLLNALRKEGINVDHMGKEKRQEVVDAMSPEAKEVALKGNEGLVGKWQLAFGEKGNKESRFFGILNKEELASIRHRAEVTLDDKGQVASIGKPLTMADIAGRMEQRVQKQRQENEAKLEAAKKVDWTKFKMPEGVSVTSLRYRSAKDNPDHVWLSGKVNGIDVFGLLSKNETTAVRNKLATLEQAGAANKDFSQKVQDILSGKQEAIGEDAAVKAIVDRASDATAKAFTPEQAGYITKFLGDIDGDGRMDVAEELWGRAKNDLDAKGVNGAWQEDAHNELKDLAQGILRSEQQSLKR